MSAPINQAGSRRERKDDAPASNLSGDCADTILFRVETVGGKKIEVTTMTLKNKVSDVKEHIEAIEGIPQAMQKMIYGGKPLSDTATLLDAKIAAGTTIHMVVALKA